MSKSWNFSVNEESKAIEYFEKNGFVGFYDLLSKSELQKIRSAVSETVKKENNGYARFVDGTVIENRGKKGKLIDMYGRLKPNR